MFCEKCGSQIPENAKFCEKCGQEVDDSVQSAPKTAQVIPMTPEQKKKILMIGGIAVGALVTLIVLIIVLLSPRTIVLDNYLEVEVSGYDGVGRVSLNVDDDALMEAINKGLDEDQQASAMAALLLGKLDLDLSETSGLSNGDVVELTATIDESYWNNLNLKFKLKKTTYEVKDLPLPNVINPFDYLVVSSTGYAPYCDFEMYANSPDENLNKLISFSCDNESYHMDIHTMSLHIVVKYNEDTLYKNGYILSETEMEYEVTDIQWPTEINIFDYIDLEIGGVDGKGTLTLTKKETGDEFLDSVRYDMSKSSYLSSGDVVTISVSYSKKPEYYGYTIKSTEMTYTVPQLGNYITDATMLSGDILTEFVDRIMTEANEFWSNLENYEDGKIHSQKTWILERTFYIDAFEYSNLRPVGVYTRSTYYSEDVGLVFAMDAVNDEIAMTIYANAYVSNLILEADGTLGVLWDYDCVYFSDSPAISIEVLDYHNSCGNIKYLDMSEDTLTFMEEEPDV